MGSRDEGKEIPSQKSLLTRYDLHLNILKAYLNHF